MHTQKQISLTRRALYGIMLLGIFFSVSSVGNLPSARAQEGATNTPTPEIGPPYPTGKFPLGRDQLRKGSPFPAQTASDVSAQALTLGAPGLSFRYVQTFGTTSVPYLADGNHLSSPNGLFIDSSDTLFVTEEIGSRVLAYNPVGTNTMILGHAGQPWGHDDFLSTPKDVTKDTAGNIWIVFNYAALKEFDPTGATVIQSFPATNNWEQGSTNDRFSDPRGIAFDAAGLMYISDSNNHRIQIYDVSGATPAYLSTIGVTGMPKSDDTGFNYPGQIAFDSLGRLYVVDTNNYRVQRCTFGIDWTCSTFFGETGVAGSDLTHLDWTNGITINGSNIFIADSANSRVLKCTTSAICALFAGETGVSGADTTHLNWPSDAAVDSSGNVFISDYHNHRVQKFSSAGVYQSTIGVTRVPYLTDNNHLNKPWGIAVAPAPDNSMYILESAGYRLIKLNSSGVFQWSVGEAGVYGSDNAHFGDYWAGVEGDPAVDSSGRIYVGDTGNNRVQIFNPNGSYYATLGGWGTGNYEFSCPTGIAISPVNGDIYVSDHCNHRIQVFTSSLVYKATLGATGTLGSDNLHFNYPYGVTVDNSGNIFVADQNNHRVQKCILLAGAPGFSCSTFAGEAEVSGSDYGHLGGPLSVKVDSAGRVYVADEWNNRVQVFDASGAYLTTISGSWGTTNGDLIGPSGIALDGSGNVYVTDRDNHRVQKFTPGTPGWQQSNINGFGDITNTGAASLQVFGTYLYAGLGNSNGGQVWRTADASSWTQITNTGFGNINNTSVQLGTVFNGYLYAGTWNQTTGCEVYRTSDGLSWLPVKSGGFNNSNNTGIGTMAVFNNELYVSTYNALTGPEIWRTSNGTTWLQSNVAGFGDANNQWAGTMAVFGNALYVGTQNSTTGAELWQTSDGVTWGQVNTDGFGDAYNQWPQLTVYNTYLYVGTANDSTDTYVGTSTQIWRSTNGTTWNQVVGNGFGDSTNGGSDVLTVFNGTLYSATFNFTSGTQIRKTTDGINWTKTALDGFGDIHNYSTHGWASFNNSLFLSATNEVNGGEIWMQNEYTLAITSANGTVTKNPDQTTYHEGDVVQLTATPNANWTFANWTGGLTSSVNPDSVTIHGNTSVTANYTQNEYILTISKIGNGTITADKPAPYHYGDVIQLTATPAAGSTFTNWSGACTGIGICTITMDAAKSLTANFTPVPQQHAKNGGFNTYSGTSKTPTSWTSVNFASTDGKNTQYKKEGKASVKIAGEAGKTKTLTQTLTLSGAAGDVFTFSFWAKGAAIPTKGVCKAQVILYNNLNKVVTTQTVNCKTGNYAAFQKKTATINATGAYAKAVIKFTYAKVSGTVWFDGVSLMR